MESLAAQFRDLQADVGHFLGYGRGPDFGQEAWQEQEQADITRSVKGGLRNFYHCGYDWSFLTPAITITLDQGKNIALLPLDFGGAAGRASVSASGVSSWWSIDFCGVGPIYQAETNQPDTTGRPQLLTIEPVKDVSHGQRYRLHVWPLADQAWDFLLPYYLNPAYLSGEKPFAYGGPQHAETLLESCLAVAEKIVDSEATLHSQEFEKRMAVSMDLDRRLKPSTFGYNADRSDLREMTLDARNSRWNGYPLVTVNGVVPG